MTTEHHTQAGALQLRSVTKIYDAKQGQHRAVDSINLDIEAGKFVTFLGPSGCGKTTTLRMIAGFEDVTEGEITLDGQSLVSVPPEKRPMSMVFQSYALFPHLTVKDNVGFGLNYQKLPAAERALRIADGLALMGIEQYAHRYPHQLSGGQQQRVALARALVMEPKIILFDEPLSNLDARLRLRMRSEIRALQQRLGLTAIFVTHDQSEALTMSDMIVVMSAGTIEQVGEPREIYHRPVNRFVASFMGTASFVAATWWPPRWVIWIPRGSPDLVLTITWSWSSEQKTPWSAWMHPGTSRQGRAATWFWKPQCAPQPSTARSTPTSWTPRRAPSKAVLTA